MVSPITLPALHSSDRGHHSPSPYRERTREGPDPCTLLAHTHTHSCRPDHGPHHALGAQERRRATRRGACPPWLELTMARSRSCRVRPVEARRDGLPVSPWQGTRRAQQGGGREPQQRAARVHLAGGAALPSAVMPRAYLVALVTSLDKGGREVFG